MNLEKVQERDLTMNEHAYNLSSDFALDYSEEEPAEFDLLEFYDKFNENAIDLDFECKHNVLEEHAERR